MPFGRDLDTSLNTSLSRKCFFFDTCEWSCEKSPPATHPNTFVNSERKRGGQGTEGPRKRKKTAEDFEVQPDEVVGAVSVCFVVIVFLVAPDFRNPARPQAHICPLRHCTLGGGYPPLYQNCPPFRRLHPRRECAREWVKDFCSPPQTAPKVEGFVKASALFEPPPQPTEGGVEGELEAQPQTEKPSEPRLELVLEPDPKWSALREVVLG